MKTRKFDFWDYDVWGNENDGFEVNDRSCSDQNRGIAFRCKDNVVPTDRQIARFLMMKPSEISTDGDDTTIYVNDSSNGKPIGEFILVE